MAPWAPSTRRHHEIVSILRLVQLSDAVEAEEERQRPPLSAEQLAGGEPRPDGTDCPRSVA
jgi:hypothetical protein